MTEKAMGSLSSFPEDSTHFRHWVMSPMELRKRRREVYDSAVERLRSRVLATGGAKTLAGLKLPAEEDVDTLVSYFIEQLLYVCEEKHFEYRVANTAAMYMSRFFLTRSALEHDPRTILMTCLLLALKVEEQAANIPLQYLCDGLVRHDASNEQSGGVRLSEVVSRELAVLDGLNFELHVLNARPSIQLLTTEYYQAYRRTRSPQSSGGESTPAATSQVSSSPASPAVSKVLSEEEGVPDQNQELARKVSQVNAAAEKVALQVIAHPEAPFVYTPAQIGTACFLQAAAGILPESEKFLERFLGTTIDNRRPGLKEDIRGSLHRLRTMVLLPLADKTAGISAATPVGTDRSALILSTLKQIYRAERLASKPPKATAKSTKRTRRARSPVGSTGTIAAPPSSFAEPCAGVPFETSNSATAAPVASITNLMLASPASSTPTADLENCPGNDSGQI